MKTTDPIHSSFSLRFVLLTGCLLPIGQAQDVPQSRPLFDGRSLAGWTSIGGKPGNWRVEEGVLTTRGDGKGWLSTNRPYRDFVLKLEYRLGPSGNSGVLIRAPHKGDPSFDGMEIQILDDDAPAYRACNRRSTPGRSTGSCPRSEARPAHPAGGTRWSSAPRARRSGSS